MKLCETCGRPAANYVADVKEGPPVVDEQGKRWVTWKKVGEHWWCREHARPSEREWSE